MPTHYLNEYIHLQPRQMKLVFQADMFCRCNLLSTLYQSDLLLQYSVDFFVQSFLEWHLLRGDWILFKELPRYQSFFLRSRNQQNNNWLLQVFLWSKFRSYQMQWLEYRLIETGKNYLLKGRLFWPS